MTWKRREDLSRVDAATLRMVWLIQVVCIAAIVWLAVLIASGAHDRPSCPCAENPVQR